MKRKKMKANNSGFRPKPVVQVVAIICAIFAVSTIAYRLRGNAADASRVKSATESETSSAISMDAHEVVVGKDDSESSEPDPDPEPESDSDAVIRIVGTETAETETTETESQTVSELSAVEAEWQNKIIPNVEDYLLVRVFASKESDIVGKLYRGNLATVLSTEGEWLKIKSGNMEGYVNSGYVFSGMEAYENAMKTLPVKAKNNAAGLRVRSEAGVDSAIIAVLEVDSTLNVNKEVESAEGWTAVEVDGKTGFVKTEFVDIKPVTGIGITIEEEKAIAEAKRKAEEEAARKAEEAKKKEQESIAAAANSASTASSGTKKKAVVVSSTEIDMLAAIIECEAGGESYESKLAVGAVVVNRIESSRFPNNMNDVLRQSGQFTPVATGQFDQVLARGANDSCYVAARDALAGNDNTGGCLFFRTANGREGLIIENMVFY